MMIGKKILRSTIAPILVFMGFFCLLYFSVNKNSVEAAVATDSYLKFPGFDSSKALGTEENPFIILEIVPHRSMGQIGYIVGGQEPIDIYAANPWDTDSLAKGAIKFTNEGNVIGSNEIFKKKILELDDGDIDNYKVRVVTITPYELNKNVQKFNKYYYDLSDNGKNNKSTTSTVIGDEIDLIANADLIYISPMPQAGGGLVNAWNNYGRDKSGASYTCTSFKDAGNDLSWQTTMELFMKVGVVANKAPLIFDYRILNTDDARFKLSVGGGKVAALNINGNNGKKLGYSGNIYKLCLMLVQNDPVTFYNMYLNPSGVTGGAKIIYDSTKETGKINCLVGGNVNTLDSNSCLYWSQYTFLPKDASGNKVNEVSISYKNYLNTNGIIEYEISGANNYHDAVIRNIYHFNGGSSLVQVFDDITREDLWVKDDRDGSGIDFNEEFFDWLVDVEGKTPRPTIATPLEAVKFILNVGLNTTAIHKDIRILELQPCKDFIFIDEAGSSAESKVKALLPYLKGNITVDRQTTSEFIGKLDDLISMYDMIYIGTNTGMMKTSGGKTVYNDPALDGLVYLHVGDRVIAHDVLYGSMKNSSGSIIKARDYMNLNTIDKSKIMKGLASSGWNDGSYKTDLIDFYRFSGNDITSIKKKELLQFVDLGLPVLLEGNLIEDDKTISKDIVDDASNIYEFLNSSRTKSNVFDLDHISTSKSSISSILAKDKLTLDMDEGENPIPYDGTSASRISGRYLNFKFKINKPTDALPDADYEWELFIDANADGKFDDGEKVPSSLISPVPGLVKADNEITASINLGNNFTDVVPWLIKVKKSGQPVDREVIRTERRGIAAFGQTTSTDKTKIYILQIRSSNSPYSNGHEVNLQDLIKQPGGGRETLFHKYTKDLKDFELIIETITVDKLLQDNINKPFDPANPHSTSRFVKDLNGDGKLRYYDMLLFGFGDCYDDIKRPNALADITHFINTGRSVMFTHDTTSIMNQPKAVFDSYNLGSGYAYWGYGINQYFRNVIGQDRYGVVKKAGDTSTTYDNANMPSQAKKAPYNSMYNGSSAYPERQGITNNALVTKYNPKGIDKLYNANKDYPSVRYGNSFKDPSNDNDYVTNWVSVVNEGQITSYPYNIPEKFQIANSHTQYYQLNMDDPDITVWYCLNDNDSSGKGTYSTTHNDVRNNYYIYSKNNIMYTVVGHSKIDAEYTGTSSYGTYEVQLFINTMIAAYQSGITGPDLRITNPEATINSSSEYVMVESSDLFESTEVPIPSKRITFIADDTTLNDHVIKVYKFDTAGNHVRVYPEIYSVDDNQIATLISDGYKVDIGREYYFNLPLGISSDYKNDGKASFYITVTDVTEGFTIGKTAHVKPIKLFMLD